MSVSRHPAIHLYLSTFHVHIISCVQSTSGWTCVGVSFSRNTSLFFEIVTIANQNTDSHTHDANISSNKLLLIVQSPLQILSPFVNCHWFALSNFFSLARVFPSVYHLLSLSSPFIMCIHLFALLCRAQHSAHCSFLYVSRIFVTSVLDDGVVDAALFESND